MHGEDALPGHVHTVIPVNLDMRKSHPRILPLPLCPPIKQAQVVDLASGNDSNDKSEKKNCGGWCCSGEHWSTGWYITRTRLPMLNNAHIDGHYEDTSSRILKFKLVMSECF